jgi:hypothetical protein
MMLFITTLNRVEQKSGARLRLSCSVIMQQAQPPTLSSEQQE